MRILIDNPGHTFTRNIDAKFVATIKDLLRDGWDLNVQHFLRETLDAIESQRQWDEDLAPLMQMWKKEKSKLSRQNSRVRLSRHGEVMKYIANGSRLGRAPGDLHDRSSSSNSSSSSRHTHTCRTLPRLRRHYHRQMNSLLA
jgi:hypothetical protein